MMGNKKARERMKFAAMSFSQILGTEEGQYQIDIFHPLNIDTKTSSIWKTKASLNALNGAFDVTSETIKYDGR